MTFDQQMKLFQDQEQKDFGRRLDIVADLKRELRRELSKSRYSRDEIADLMRDLASAEGIKVVISRNILDSWLKPGQQDRLPGITGLMLLCRVLGTVAPFGPIIQALGGDVVGTDDLKLLIWAKAEKEKREATKRARLAQELLEI